MLRFVAGAEEQHTNNAVGMGWVNASGITVYTPNQNTGNNCYLLSLLHSGISTYSWKTGAAKCWWSFASVPFLRSSGTYLYLFHILTDNASAARYLVWFYNAGDGKYYLKLCSDTTLTTLATTTNGNTYGSWCHFKLEFDNDNWTLWSDLSGAWQEEFTYSDSTTAPYVFSMSLNFSADIKSASAYPLLDDCCFWDEDGDNWNSRGSIDTYANACPRISVAHMPAAGRESHAGQGVKIDEIPPDAVDKATIDETDYYVQVEALDAGVKGPEDLTAETIQALLITHAAGDFAAEDAEMSKFNVKRSGTLYADSEDYRVQLGTSGAGAGTWWQTAGYYPWTPIPSPENWTPDIFNACDYGISLINGETDQMTVQAIFFGTSHEWEPPAVATRRVRGLVV